MDAAPVPPSQNNGNGAGTGVKISEGKNEMNSSVPPTASQEQPCGLEVLSSAATGAGGNHVVHVEPHGHGGNLASDYYDVDGMLYSVTTSGGENDGSYIDYTNFFSANDVYAVTMADPSNGTLTEIEDWPNHPHHASFIPLGNSDLRQLHSHHAAGVEGNNGNVNAAAVVNGNPSNNDNSHGARVPEETGPNSLGYSNGSFHQMLRRTYETSQQPSNNVEVMSTASSNSLDSYASQDAPQEVPTHQNSPMQAKLDGQGSQGPVKVRKPRGRKPKHVKEAEAAAAALALAAQQQAASQAQQAHVGTAPGTPIRDGEGYPLRNAQGPMLTMHHRPASQDQQVEGNQQQRPQQQNLDQVRRMNALPPNFVSRNGSTYQAIHVQRHPNNGSGSNNFNLHSHVAAQMTNTAAQVVGANGGGRLDQLFSSRIAAPSNNDKSMDQDKPNIIQANRSIYKLLTAPTIPRPGPGGNFDSKTSQERWMQMPNPVAPEDTGAGARGTTPSSAGASGPSGQNRGPPTANQQPGAASVHLVGGFNNRVNIRRDDGRPLPPTTIRIGPGGSTASHHGGMGHHPRSNSSDYINVRSENYREMYNQLDMFANDNYQLRCGNHYLRKKVKSLMVQLKQAYETIEGLKISVQERSLFAHRDFHAPGHGNASPERSLLDESFGSTSGAMFGDLAHGGNGEDELGFGVENGGEERLWRQSRGRLNLAAAGLGVEGSTSGGGASTMANGTTRGELKVVKRSLSESESVPAAKKLCTGNNGVESSTGEKSEDKLSQRSSDGTSTVDSNASTLSPELIQKNKEIAEANEGGGSSEEKQSPVHSDSTERVSAYDGENSTSTIFNSPIDSRLVTSTTLPIQRTTSLLSAHVTKVIEYHPIRNFSNIASTPKKLDTGVAEAAKDKANGEGYQEAQQARVQNQNRDGDDQYFLMSVANNSSANGAGEQADNQKT